MPVSPQAAELRFYLYPSPLILNIHSFSEPLYFLFAKELSLNLRSLAPQATPPTSIAHGFIPHSYWLQKSLLCWKVVEEQGSIWFQRKKLLWAHFYFSKIKNGQIETIKENRISSLFRPKPFFSIAVTYCGIFLVGIQCRCSRRLPKKLAKKLDGSESF